VTNPADISLTNTGVPDAIKVLSGSGKSAAVGTTFAAPLEVKVTNASGQPVAGITVVFALSGTGAGGTFSGSGVVVTNASGVAIAPGLTANNVTGKFTVDAYVTGVSGPAVFTLTNEPAPAVRRTSDADPTSFLERALSELLGSTSLV
jgi:hypothetical protein